MAPSPENFAFWLMPAAKEQRFFSSLIGDLALRFAAPVFEAHLTVNGGDVSEEAALEALRKVQAWPSYELEIEALDVSEQFTKTLFIRFRLSPELNQLRAAIGAALSLPSISAFDPHLSLLYNEMPLSKKMELARAIEIPFRRVTFVSLSVIAHPVEIKTRKDVEAWRTIARRPLVECSR